MATVSAGLFHKSDGRTKPWVISITKDADRVRFQSDAVAFFSMTREEALVFAKTIIKTAQEIGDEDNL